MHNNYQSSLGASQLVRLKELFQLKLYDKQQQVLGLIHDVLIAKDTGVCQFVVLTPEPPALLDQDDYLVIPWCELSFLPTGEFVINLSAAQLKCLARISTHDWHNYHIPVDVNTDCGLKHAADYPSLTPFPNANNNEQLAALIKTQEKQTAKELLVEINDQGVNENPSEQTAYPGPQLYDTNTKK